MRILLTELKSLNGTHIDLEPIEESHREELGVAADNEQIWRYMPQRATGTLFNPWFDECLEKMHSGEQITYVARCKKDKHLKGATAFYDIQLENKRLTLGYSWYATEAWGTAVNPESKLLMLNLAFESWGIHRIELGTDSRNLHSYNAIKKLGAIQEGILRSHMILHDQVATDTIVFSILLAEWPDVKARLLQRLGAKDVSGSRGHSAPL